MKKSFFFLAMSLGILASCSNDTSDNTKIRTEPVVITRAEADIINYQTGFAAGLYNYFLNSTDINANFVLSPLSASYHSGMVANGAIEDYSKQLVSVLCPAENTLDDLNKLNSSLMKQLPKCDSGVKLTYANGIWIDKKINVKQEFSTITDSYYDARITKADFNAKDDLANEINRWADKNTSGLITELPNLKGNLENVNIFFANALLFEGKWETPFESKATVTKKFVCADGSCNAVDFMNSTSGYLYAEYEGLKAVVLPYSSGSFRMILIMNENEGGEVVLSEQTIAGIKSALTSRYISVSVPKFDIASNLSIAPAISGDFPNDMILMSYPRVSDDNVYGKYPVQVSRIIVDETGTKAASVTYDGYVTSPGLSASFTADHPFSFIIEEKTSGAIVMMGRINSLSKADQPE